MSNQSYKELGIPYFKEVFDCIDEVMKTLDVRYCLIGVNAIALELLKQNIKPARGTKDIDFAVMVSSMEEYSQIVSELEKEVLGKCRHLGHSIQRIIMSQLTCYHSVK